MKINEFDKQVTQADIDELEKFADKIFAKVGIDVNFTRHFLDRVNDERNGKPISMSELTRLFKQEQKRWGKKIAQLGPDEEAVMKDLQTDLNLPFALRWDDKNNELDLIAKTVMRKKNFRTPNPEFPVESIEESKAELYRLYTKAMKIPAGSPKHKELADKIAKLRKELSMDEDIDPVDMAAAAGVSGAVGSMIGNKVGKAVDRDLRGDGPEDRRRIKRIKQDRQKKLTKTPSVRGNANTATKPTSAPMTAKLPGVTRGGTGAGGAAINPKRIGGGGRIEPKLRGTPFNMFNESGLPPHLAKHFDKDGDAVKGSWKDGKWTADKKQPKKVKYTVKDVTPKGYGPLEEHDDASSYVRKLRNVGYSIYISKIAGGEGGIRFEVETPSGKEFEIIEYETGYYELFTDGPTMSGKGKVFSSLIDAIRTAEHTDDTINEDFGSVPPLAELILMAVVAKTSVDVLVGMFKVALKTGKGLKKLNDLRKRVTKMGQGVADYALPEATKDEFMAKLKDQQKNKFIDAALEALHRLVTSKGGRQTIGGYAFDIARAFNGVNAKELEKMYRAKFSESIIHEDTLNELNILRKKNDGVKQSNPLVVLDKLSDRNDDTPFPIKFYDGTSIKVTPKMARRFMNKYYDDLEPEQRDIVDRYITTKNGFIQAVKKLQIAEGK
jgi:hypothetical protein